nr:hypothetical protein HK105_005805 [Polyrhizophydium stewartii]
MRHRTSSEQRLLGAIWTALQRPGTSVDPITVDTELLRRAGAGAGAAEGREGDGGAGRHDDDDPATGEAAGSAAFAGGRRGSGRDGWSADSSAAGTPVLLRSAPGSSSSLLGRLDAAFASSASPAAAAIGGDDTGDDGIGGLGGVGGAAGGTGGSDAGGRGGIVRVPNEVLIMVMAHVGNRRQRGWGYAAIRACALVDRRWNLCASSFLWRHVEIESQRSFELLMRTLRLGGLATHQYGRSVHSISLMGVAVPPEDWAVLLRECRNVQSLHLERFCYGAQGTPTRLTTMLMHGGGAGGGAGGAGSHVNVGQIHAPMSTLAPSAAMSATTPDAPMSADAGGGIVDASKLLAKFRELVVDDSPQLPLGPIVQLLERAPKTRRLAISGCNFNEENMCTLVYYCPCLVDISLGSHMSNGQTLSGSAGGDAFANALATTCPELRAADLTGIVSMTDEGFANLIRTRGPQLHALQVRRAMQISVDALRMIATHCAHGALKRLTLANIPHMTDELLLQILGSPLVESLECLQLEALAVGDATIAQVARLGVRLRQLRLYDLDQLADLASVVGGGRHTLPKLRQLVVHGSFRLAEETPLVCVHGTLGAATGSQMASPQVVERLIYHISEMDPATALGTPDLVTPQSAFGGCSIAAPHLGRLEIVGCNALKEETLAKLLRHWVFAKRFVYVGPSVSKEFRQQLAKAMPKCNSSVYVLSPQTPNF